MAEPSAGLRAARPSTVHGWGARSPARVWEWRPAESAALLAGFSPAGGAGRIRAIARGYGRSYGDAAQITGGLVINTSELSGYWLDDVTGSVVAETGASLGSILGHCVPRGWILPVTPGTQHVSVGGAIASDVHGKNHAAAGSFGDHVEAIGLLTSSGVTMELTPGNSPALFDATVGGMGLTGLILWARLKLSPVQGAALSVDTDRTEDLDQALTLLSGSGGQHRVAWLDPLARKMRGIVTRAEHLHAPDSDASPVTKRIAVVPPFWPGFVLNRRFVQAYNASRLRRTPRTERESRMSYGKHMFPLDALGAWPRLYGNQGLIQYQFGVPAGRDDVLSRVFDQLRRARVPSYLAVLKHMGAASGRPLSFPIRGWSLALDIPAAAAGLDAALDRCDELVAEAGGRVYLAKDSRVRAETLRAMYPGLARWQAIRDDIDPGGLWRSDLGIRTGLVS